MSAELLAQFLMRYGKDVLVEGDLRQPTDRFSITVLFGPSGCGKTTILRCLAGLERPTEGRIVFAGTTWFDHGRRVCLTPQERGIGFLFQEYALFPHLSVARNIGYGLKSNSRSRHLVAEIIRVFQLTGLEDRYPHQVSGGEQQRIALARVLVGRPRLLLLDEPLSALDQPTRELLRPELGRLLRETGIPTILVTHDRTEAMALADQLIVLHQGRISQKGTVEDVFNHPVNLDVARIVGMGTVAAGRITKTAEGLATVVLGNTELIAPAPDPISEHVYVCIRPEEVVLQKGVTEHTSARNRLRGVIKSLTSEGPLVRATLDCGFPLIALVTRMASEELALREGEEVTALVKVAGVHLIPRP